MKNVSDESCKENQSTQFVLGNIGFRKRYLLIDNVEKYCRAGQATVENMAHAHCMLDTQGYKYTHSSCVTHCFSTATMHLNVPLYVHCPSC